jgi:hypothetical protein
LGAFCFQRGPSSRGWYSRYEKIVGRLKRPLIRPQEVKALGVKILVVRFA